ncbi:MAG: rod shape-determining protein MreC [Candidatus Buchananbacteria bacterium RIFCSPHIGHO2_01_FULL_39_14]|uniref:Cell shape-determining protein MreC n=2 Tax=Candidatus Buchananiibacteriota TaxID=1817903 RepID=A0A1G1YPT7_9BACT|nr:MAG: rod shape-determining protein MreC [Candidatus Buchananbacteria bacterium RIFCSPHIGHO2_01_FULL_39_14]OGY48852.1 MAG: rod shape-determining protein MreC [Candidatus Buchananbacteria bacterium RIFCSPHIGHO2_02_FULL_39_17]OGY54372.1 MAG: rod shape-determining protein MreC [Candidatus Buchananbacteria bacterium RIFCSPLOWO2_01_FULL_40_23b]
MFRFLKSWRLSATLLAAVILLIFLHYLKIILPLEDTLIRIFSPIQYRVYLAGVKINDFYYNLTSRGNLVDENEKLRNQLVSLAAENSQLKIKLEALDQLIQQNNFLLENKTNAVLAKVVGKNPEPNHQSLILNKGSEDGVLIDYPVITERGIIIGKILSVEPHSSQLLLLTDSKSRLAAMIQGQNQIKGVVVGEHGLSLKMEMVSQKDEIKEGEIVVTSGLEPTIPAGLVIGSVNRASKEANNFFQTVQLQSLIRIDDLIVVSILTDSL